MIRAMIGTVAVLAGFAVVERSVDASTGQGDACTPTDSYTWLQQGEFVPLRAEPSMGVSLRCRMETGTSAPSSRNRVASAASAYSTSRTEMFWPPRMISCFLRPASQW